MSQIKIYDGINGNSPVLVKILQNKINIICQRIGYDESNVLWMIYDPKVLYENKIKYAIPVD